MSWRAGLAAFWVIAALLTGCQDDQIDEPPRQDADQGSELPLQPTRRFPLGHTFYLPGSGWELVQAPDANRNGLFEGDDGFSRFTPIVAGNYSFSHTTSGRQQDLRVVTESPYAHYNYYPTSSLAQVGQEVWVAHVFDPHLSRLDPATGTVLGTIDVGPWPVAVAHRPGMDFALVAHKAGDTVGFVDITSRTLVDALWVGDEPAEIALSPDGRQAWVSLTTEDAVVLIDVEARKILARIPTNLAPTAMALSPDGETLFVASYRSGVSDRLQFGTDSRYDDFDVAVIDTAERVVTGYVQAVGSNLGGLLVHEDRLYVATTRSVVSEYSGQEGMTAFRHTVVSYDLQRGMAEVAAVDIGRQESAAGLAVRPYGMTIAGGTLWVAVEGSDIAVGLDPQTLAERARFEVPGRPRSLLAVGDQLLAHGAQSYAITVANPQGQVLRQLDLDGDPRPSSMALGQRLYTGAGQRSALHHGCADCHIDGLTDGNIWSAGGFSESASRPMFWMEGTDPIGWEGDAFDLFSYLFGSPGPTIGVQVSTEAHQAFYDYLSAFEPPPAPNGLTRRDGSMTEEASAGEGVFKGAGNCAGCHAGPLKTQGLRLEGGGTQTEHPIVVPSLVGAYRHGSWLVNGAARTMEEAVVAMEPLAGARLSDDQRASLVRYLRELSAREFFLLTSSPRSDQSAVAADSTLELTFSHAVFDDADNLARIVLRDEAGVAVPTAITASGRHVSLTPRAGLTPGSRYEVVIPDGFEAFNEMTITPSVVRFTVAQQPGLRLEGEYVITVDHPNLDFEARAYDPEVLIPVSVTATATPTAAGAELHLQVTELLDTTIVVTIEGDASYWPPFPFPVGPGFLNRSFPTTLQLQDTDGDGVADAGQSTLLLRSPGLEASGVVWRLERPADDLPPDPDACDLSTGTHRLELTFDGQGNPLVAWADDVNALGFFVTDPDAQTPFGPGTVTGGTSYWTLSTTAFPAGFSGPVAYGEVPDGASDTSMDNGAMPGGSPLPQGACIKVTLVFNDFSTSELRYVQAQN